MKKRRFVLLFAIFLFCVAQVQAQWDVLFSRSWTARTYYNPSFAGETDKIQVSGTYKYLWANIENAPRHIFLSVDMPVEFWGLQHGIGIQTFSNAIGNERNSLLAAQYTYRQKFGKGMLNIGVQAGTYALNFDAASINLSADSAKNNRKIIKANLTDKKTVDLNAGISWTTNNFHIGAAVMHINQPSFYFIPSENTANDSTFSKIAVSYNFMAGCNITAFHPLFEIQPAVLLLTNFTNTRLQTILRMVYNKKYSAGASWNRNEGYSFFAGAVIENVEVGYAYDLYLSGIGKNSGGNHEVSFRYRLPIELFKRNPMPYKSIRLL